MSNRLTLFKSFLTNYWKYYRELEDEFISTQKYVYLHEDNFSTYSIEYLKLYQAICSEIDVIGKAMAAFRNSNFKPDDTKNNILKWWYEIQDGFLVSYQYDDIAQKNIKLNEYSALFMDKIEIIPWNKFNVKTLTNKNGNLYYSAESSVPSWWSDYNKVKHNRTSIINENSTKINYSKANLGNVCHALAALYTLEKAYMEAVGTKDELEAFADYSKCFDKVENVTSSFIDSLFDESPKDLQTV